jgi:hypothetical protein
VPSNSHFSPLTLHFLEMPLLPEGRMRSIAAGWHTPCGFRPSFPSPAGERDVLNLENHCLD